MDTNQTYTLIFITSPGNTANTFMQHITQYDGLYGETVAEAGNHRSNGEYLYSELLETRSRNFDWIILPHIHARLFQLFFVRSGTFQFQDAAQTRQLTGPCLLLIPPTSLHGFAYETGVQGRILTLSDTLINALFPAASPVTAMLGTLHCLTTFEEPYPAARIDTLLAGIDEELFANQAEKRLMLHVSLQQVVLVIYRQWQQHETPETQSHRVALQHFRAFQQRVRQVGTTHSITQLAAELSITPVHLNRVCRLVAGKSASQLVQDHILEEAINYLKYTTYSVSEIAYLLHFDYPNYFARFFRKHTDLSPTEFRAQQNP